MLPFPRMSEGMNRTLSRWLMLCLGLCLLGRISLSSVFAEATQPVIFVIDSSSQTAVSQAIDFVVPFITAYTPVSIVTTCSPVSGLQAPTQDAAAVRAALTALSACDTSDHAQALQ